MDPGLSVAEAAKRLRVNEARIRALLACEGLRGQKVGGRWLVERQSLEARRRAGMPSGRPFAPATAWAALALAEGRPVVLSAPARSRLRRWLREVGLEKGLARLRRRADSIFLRAHASDLPRFASEAGVVKSGVSAADAYQADILARDELEAYVAQARLPALRKRYLLAPSERPNVHLRVVSGSWPFDKGVEIAPLVVAAIDLLDSDDDRVRRAGRALLASVAP
jgi:excisionase family DNA binding protein